MHGNTIRRLGDLCVTLALAALVGCGGGGTGFVVATMAPQSGSTVTGSPATVVLRFTEDLDDVTVDATTIRVLGSGGDGTFNDGNEVPVSPAGVAVTGAREATVTLGAALPADDYQVFVAGRDAGTALDFDGVNDLVRIPANPNFAPGTGSMTIECWVALDDLDRANVPVTCADFDFWNGWRLIQEPPAPINGAYYFIVESEVSGDDLAAIGTTPPGAGAWHHIAGTYDSAAGTVRLYVDGELVTEFTNAPVGAITPSADLFFCRYFQSSAGIYHHLDGRLDEVRLWNRARNAVEIKRDYNRALTGTEPGLVGYWSFNSDSGQTVRDGSTVGSDGTLGDDSAVGVDEPVQIPSTAWKVVCNDNGAPLGGGSDYVGTFRVQ